MSRIPLPERGQPLDLTYVYQMAEAINDLSVQVNPSQNRYITIDTPTDGKQSVLTSGAKINAAYIEVSNSRTVIAGTEQDFTYQFPSEYKYAPVATASPVNAGGTPAGREISVIIKNVTTSRVDGVIKYNASGTVTVGVNLIVVGIPN